MPGRRGTTEYAISHEMWAFCFSPFLRARRWAGGGFWYYFTKDWLKCKIKKGYLQTKSQRTHLWEGNRLAKVKCQTNFHANVLPMQPLCRGLPREGPHKNSDVTTIRTKRAQSSKRRLIEWYSPDHHHWVQPMKSNAWLIWTQGTSTNTPQWHFYEGNGCKMALSSGPTSGLQPIE